MKRIFRNILVVLIAIFLAVVILVVQSIINGEDITFDSFMYGLIIGGGQAIIPFLIFFSIVNYIIVKSSQRNQRYERLLWQMLIALGCMTVVILAMTAFDLYDSPKKVKEKEINYLLDYSLFIVFVPLAVIINYLLYGQKKLSANS